MCRGVKCIGLIMDVEIMVTLISIYLYLMERTGPEVNKQCLVIRSLKGEVKMDLILDILIPKDNLDKINLTEIFVEWGGEKFSQNPKKYHYKSKLIFHENTEMNYYHNIVENDVDVYDCIALTLEWIYLSELEVAVNNKDFRKEKSDLLSLFYEMYDKLNTFCIIKFLNEEDIDDRYLLSNANDAVNIFIRSLYWDSARGIIIIKK